MNNRVTFIVFLVCVGIVLFLPLHSRAQSSSQFLFSPSESNDFLDVAQKEVSKLVPNSKILSYTPQEQAALTIFRGATREAILRFLPAFVGTESIKFVIKAASLLQQFSAITIKEVLDEIEKQTVEKAVEIGNAWLFQNEIRTGSGSIENQSLSTTFQYVITSQSITNDRGNIVIEFYSPDSLIAPSARGSVGSYLGFVGDSPYVGKVAPFIIRIQTQIEKDTWGWAVDSSADTKITVEFPEKVPVLQLAKEWPYPLEEQKINLLNTWTTAKKILEYLRSTGSEAFGKTADFAHKAQEVVESFINRASQLLSKSGAGLINPLNNESQQLDAIETQLNLVKDALRVKEDQAKLSLETSVDIKSQQFESQQFEDETNPVENLVKLSFPQIQQEVVQEEAIVEIKSQQFEDEAVLPQEQPILDLVKDTVWCTVDPNRGPGLSTVMFSEIAWMGSINSANDEWVRLKNISNGEVNLAGWQVLDKDKQIAVAFDGTHTVSPQGMFLLERTNDDSLPAAPANRIYTGALSNTDEALYLFDQNCILRDKVVASPNWLAGDNASKKPMMRSNDLSWYTHGSGNAVFSALTNGSPGTANPYTAGSPPPIIYPRILISEVQTAGSSSQTEEFLELYNPTQGHINLTDWYVQKKTQGAESFATFASKNILSGKTIQAGGYFLIAREGSFFASSADVVTSYSLADNNTLVLKNPNGEITDKVGWGNVQDAEGSPALNPQVDQSLNRIWDAVNQTYYDRDNNSIDFVLHNPASPKAQNIENDTTAPAAIANLSVSNPTTSSIQLAWTAPGDDGSAGTAVNYDVRYSTASITGDNFNSATQVTGEPTPSQAGSNESMIVSGLSAGTTYYFALKLSDEVPNTSVLSNVPSLATIALPPPPQDTTAPQVTLNTVASSQSDVSFVLSWTTTDSGGEASASGVQSIFIEYTVTPSATGVFAQYDNNGVWTNWQAGSAGRITLNAQATSLSLRAQDGASYTFQITAKDAAGNESSANAASTTVALLKTIVISEIAWAGTKAQSTDEWLELFNTTDSLVDLTGWRIVSSDSEGPELTLVGTIASGGFYLIERTDDQATTVTAQLTASFGVNGLSNTACEVLYLHNAQDTVVDQTICKSDGSWPAGKASPDYISMERVASTAGSSLTNWTNNNLIQYNNKDAANNWINGTPRQPNSTVTSPTTIADGTMRFDEFSTLTLTTLGSPYIAAVSIIIPAGKTLIVEPGVQVKFQNNSARLAVEGTIKAQGTQTNGITFTVTDGGTVWCGINVTSTSTSSQLDYVTIDKAQSLVGGGCNVSFITYSMYVESSAVTINNSVIQTGAEYRKLYLKNSNSVINATTISGAALNTESVGIYIDGGSPTISNSTISNNSIGILVNGLANNPTIQNNTFTGNAKAVKLESAGAVLSGNAASSNTYNGIFVEGITQANTTWQKDSIPYIINKFTVSAGTTLTIQAGAVVKFINLGYTNPELVVNGTLVTQGTLANPVVFTKISDDTVGGSNTYGGAGSISSWKRIYIAPGSTGSQLTYTTLKYGGNTYPEAALYVKQSDVQLSNLTISNSSQSAIYSSLGAVSGSGVTLISNTYGFHIELGDCPALSGTNVTANGGPTLHPSSFPSPPCSF